MKKIITVLLVVALLFSMAACASGGKNDKFVGISMPTQDLQRWNQDGENMKKQLEAFEPDAIEIMPGVMPRIIRQIRSQTKTAIIAGGLLTDKKDVMAALEAGADAVSTTSVPLWSV